MRYWIAVRCWRFWACVHKACGVTWDEQREVNLALPDTQFDCLLYLVVVLRQRRWRQEASRAAAKGYERAREYAERSARESYASDVAMFDEIRRRNARARLLA